MEKGTVIFLNGTSSSGKTTVAKAFQKEMDDPVLYVSNDQYIFMVNERDLKNDELRPRILLPLLSAFHHSLPLIGTCGFPMIIDHVIERKDWMDEIVENLEGYKVFFVKVDCSLMELERREKERGDRKIGFAKWQYEIVHGFCDYDFEINTEINSPEENALKLKELFHSNRYPKAFDQYREILNAKDKNAANSNSASSP